MDKVIAAVHMSHPVLSSTNPDEDMIQKFNDLKQDALRIVLSAVSSKSGRLIGDYEGATIVEIPLESVEVLKEIKKRVKDEVGIKQMSIGVGESVDDAMVALREARKESSIKVFRPEMVEDTIEPASVAVEEGTEPVRKAEITEDAQKTIVDLVGKINQNKDYVETLKQNNPPAYEALIEVMQAIASMVSHIKDTTISKAKADELGRLEKIVDSVHDGRLDIDEKAVLNEILNDLRSKKDIRKSESDSEESRLKRAKDSDLVTLPDEVKGTNCANCKFVDKVTDPSKPFCKHVKVNQEVTPRMCCKFWDAEGTDREWLDKAEGDYSGVMSGVVQKLHSAIPFFEQVRSEKPEVFGTFVKLVRLLQTLHEDHAQTKQDKAPGHEEAQPHGVRPPAHSQRLTHPKPTYAPGSQRQYAPGVAREKTQTGEWKSISGGVKREGLE